LFGGRTQGSPLHRFDIGFCSAGEHKVRPYIGFGNWLDLDLYDLARSFQKIKLKTNGLCLINEDGNLARGHISCHEKSKLNDNIIILFSFFMARK